MAKICNKTFAQDCDVCYETTKSSPCVTTISFTLGLTVGLSYYFWVIDKFSNAYRETVTVIAGGKININTANYPDGFFNKNAGIFKAFLTTDAAGANKVTFTVATIDYECIIFEIV
jgi:hypothetical protein